MPKKSSEELALVTTIPPGSLNLSYTERLKINPNDHQARLGRALYCFYGKNYEDARFDFFWLACAAQDLRYDVDIENKKKLLSLFLGLKSVVLHQIGNGKNTIPDIEQNLMLVFFDFSLALLSEDKIASAKYFKGAEDALAECEKMIEHQDDGAAEKIVEASFATFYVYYLRSDYFKVLHVFNMILARFKNFGSCLDEVAAHHFNRFFSSMWESMLIGNDKVTDFYLKNHLDLVFIRALLTWLTDNDCAAAATCTYEILEVGANAFFVKNNYRDAHLEKMKCFWGKIAQDLSSKSYESILKYIINSYKDLDFMTSSILFQRSILKILTIVIEEKLNCEGRDYYYRGYAYENMGDFKRALQDYQSSLIHAKEKVPALLGMGNCYLKQDMQAEAFNQIKAVLAIDPTNVASLRLKPFMEYGLVAFGNKSTSFLLELKERTINISFLEKQAKIFAAQKKIDFAIRNYSLILGCYQNNAAIWNARGQLYLQNNDFEKAKCDFEDALGVDHQNIEALNSLGFISCQNNKFNDALYYFQEVLKLESTNNVALTWRGKIYETFFINFLDQQTFDLAEADVYFRKAQLDFQGVLKNSSYQTSAWQNLLALYLRYAKFLVQEMKGAHNVVERADRLIHQAAFPTTPVRSVATAIRIFNESQHDLNKELYSRLQELFQPALQDVQCLLDEYPLSMDYRLLQKDVSPLLELIIETLEYFPLFDSRSIHQREFSCNARILQAWVHIISRNDLRFAEVELDAVQCLVVTPAMEALLEKVRRGLNSALTSNTAIVPFVPENKLTARHMGGSQKNTLFSAEGQSSSHGKPFTLGTPQ